MPKVTAKKKTKDAKEKAPAGGEKAKATTPKATALKAAKAAFPKKAQAPTPAEFVARLPLALGKRFEAVRLFLLKRKGVSEDVFFYGPKSGWALRYLRDARPVCALFIHGERPLGIVSLEGSVCDQVDWKALSPVARNA